MRLRDLDATFVGDWHVGVLGRYAGGFTRLPGVDHAQGLLFQCPGCAVGKPRAADGGIVGDHYVLAWFANPINAPPVPPEAFPAPGRWTFSGGSLDDATLTPSVNCDIHPTENKPSDCHWHGWVKNGDAT